MLTEQIKTENFSGGNADDGRSCCKTTGICLQIPHLFISALICSWVGKRSYTSSVTHVFYFIRTLFVYVLFNYSSEVIICPLKAQIPHLFVKQVPIFHLIKVRIQESAAGATERR